ncbi:MAG: zinc metallopeptidase [Peptococcaceae bacterium]|nr:zinc metallopeptidase [Peptococcaceae bacterium]
MFFGIWDLFLIPAILVTIYAQMKVDSTYKRYSRVPSSCGMTGADVARYILNQNGLYDIPIEVTGGHLSDHYDPRARVVRLSQDVYYGSSLASLGVAAHEVGHAVQHDTGYLPLYIRNTVIPVTQFGSTAAIPLFLLGLFMSSEMLITLGIVLFSAIVFFQMVTLPVEFNASSRALATLGSEGILDAAELKGTSKVLRAAALTYVAAALTAVMELLRLVLMSGILGGNDD